MYVDKFALFKNYIKKWLSFNFDGHDISLHLNFMYVYESLTNLT